MQSFHMQCLLLNIVLADSPHSKCPPLKKLMFFSSITRPNLLCFGFDLNPSQRTIHIFTNGYPEMDISRNVLVDIDSLFFTLP